MDDETGPDDEFAFMVKVGDAGQARAVEAARRALSLENAQLVRAPDMIHATIVHVCEAVIEQAVPLAKTLAPLVRVPGFTLVFDRCEWRPHPRHTPNGIAVLVVSELPAPWRSLRDQLAEVPRRLKQRKTGGAEPHLTVAYGCVPFEPVKLETPVIWHVTNFQLIRILMGKRRHLEIARWELM